MPTLFRLRRGASSGRPRSRLRRLLGRIVSGAVLAFALSVLAVLALRWIPPFTSMMMMERRVGALFAHRALRIDYRWTRWERISPNAGLAVVAAEDQNFAAHHGFDFESIQKALDAHQRGRRLRGASTISQQVAKNVFLWSGRSYVRKGLEAYFTVLVELLWPKRRILEVYLNIAELGDGVFGVEAASQRYFRKPASRLGPEEAALLAAVLPNPLRFRVNRPSPYVAERRAWIVQQMWQMGGAAYLDQF